MESEKKLETEQTQIVKGEGEKSRAWQALTAPSSSTVDKKVRDGVKLPAYSDNDDWKPSKKKRKNPRMEPDKKQKHTKKRKRKSGNLAEIKEPPRKKKKQNDDNKNTSLYLGLYWSSASKIWVSSGTVDGKLQRFATGKDQHELSKKTKEICKELRKEGHDVKNEYGILKTKKRCGFSKLPYVGIRQQKNGSFVGYGFVNDVRTYLGCGSSLETCAAAVRKRTAEYQAKGCTIREAYGQHRKNVATL